MASAYKRGTGSMYSEKDLADAERVARLEKRVSSDVLRRKQAGEKGLHMTAGEVESRSESAKQNYLRNLSTESGRKQNIANEQFVRTTDLPKANSKAQYDAEKEAGDPYAMSMSYEAWKNLD